MATMTIRCDEADKRAAAAVAAYYGFDLSSVTRAFWKQMARTQAIPLTLGPEEPNEATYAAIDAAENDRDMQGPFESVSAMMEALDA